MKNLIDVHQAQLARLAVDDGEHDHAEADLQLRILVEVVEHHLGLLAAFQLHHDAHAVAVAMVHHIGDAFDALLIHHRRDLFEQLRLIHLVGNFVDDDLLAILAHLLDLGARTDLELSAAGRVGLLESLPTQNKSAGGKIRTLHKFQHLRQRGFGMLDLVNHRIDDLGEIVRRNIGRHPHRDARRSVHQQIGNARRQNFRLGLAIVVVRLEIDRLFIEVFEQRGRHARQAGFGVPVGRRRIAIHRAEIALALHQRIAHGERLRQPHQGIVDRQVAVRMILAHASPTMRAHLRVGRLGCSPICCMV